MSIRTRFNPLGTIGRKGLLPAGYIELEYLESTGEQYIDTGLLCNYSYIIDLDIVTLKAKGIGFQSFFGYATPNTQNYKLSAYVGQNNNFAAYIGNDAAVSTPNDVATPGSKHSIRITEKCFYVDNILYSDSAPVLQIGNGNMYLFARNGNFNSGQFRIYNFKVKLNNTLVLNFIPAIDPTGRPCMFDTVSQQPFYNEGTGEFLYKLKNIDYITDGLILWFDAKLEAPGTKHYLTNWASGTKCQFDNVLTIRNKVITNDGAAMSVFNKQLLPIDGTAAYGMDYTADVAYIPNPEVNTKSITGMIWADGTSGSYRVPCFQIYTNSTDGGTVPLKRNWIRIGKVLNNTTANTYLFDDYNPRSLHLEFANLYQNGNAVPLDISSGAAGPGGFGIAAGMMLYSYRLYNRKLTVEEQMHNYAIDKKRFGVA